MAKKKKTISNAAARSGTSNGWRKKIIAGARKKRGR